MCVYVCVYVCVCVCVCMLECARAVEAVACLPSTRDVHLQTRGVLALCGRVSLHVYA